MSKVRMSIGVGSVAILMALVPAGLAGAWQTPTTGQPGTSAGFNCGSGAAITTPGQASSAPGSAFNSGGHAGTVYAGNGTGSKNAGSSAAVSQYDAACRRLTAN